MSCTIGTSYIVKPGDTLAAIAQQLMGDASRWAEIRNPDGTSPDADKLQPGQELCVPDGEAVVPVSETQFNQMFPSRNAFYSYNALTVAATAYPRFATTGSEMVRKQEAAAFLANVDHETGGLVYVVEQDTANYPNYCDSSQSYGCPAGQAEYYGRGPIQLSWNFNYKAAGDALGIDLLRDPSLVATDAVVSWKTGLWYWMTQTGPGSMTAHEAMVSGAGFGETIRSINGSLECDGRNPGEMQSRVGAYQRFTQMLGVPTGANLTC